MDMSLLHPLNRLFAAHDWLEDPLVAYANASEIVFLGLLIAAFLLVRGDPAQRSATRRAVVASGLSAGLGLAVAQVITRVVDRPRPFVAHPHAVELFAKHAADPGFPSDHATAAFAISVALLLRSWSWGGIALVAAVVLAVTRVAMGIHYPTDVLAGAVVGGLSALIMNLRPGRAVVRQLADAFGSILEGTVRSVQARLAPTRS
jgi:membrane-associated phospholipid phosphatase